jgi:hypothetical protein
MAKIEANLKMKELQICTDERPGDMRSKIMTNGEARRYEFCVSSGTTLSLEFTMCRENLPKSFLCMREPVVSQNQSQPKPHRNHTFL